MYGRIVYVAQEQTMTMAILTWLVAIPCWGP